MNRFSYLLPRILMISLLSASLPAQTTKQNNAGSPNSPSAGDTTTAGFQDRYPRYRLVAGDIATISFPFNPELNQTIRVQPDGFVSLPEAPDVRAQGLTVKELQESIKQAYAPIIHDPVFTVTLTQFSSPFIIVGGRVRTPGRYDLHGNLTLLQAIEVAGGFTEESKHSQVWLYHAGLDGSPTQAKPIDVKAMLAKGSTAEDLVLKPGDMIYVPQNNFSKFKNVIVPKPVVGFSYRP
jgi:polysaccharide export outer membrane protein